ncbi:ExbD/TolR family protein [Candidatus Latescibacterota bacterium]
MSLKRNRDTVLEPDSFNLTPLIDCVFLLLIFFMVTTVMKNPAQLKLTLPIAENPSILDKRQIIVELSEEGDIAVNSEETAIDFFDTFLVNAKNDLDINTVLIKADENAKHGDVLKLMKLARSVEIETIAMAVDTAVEEE